MSSWDIELLKVANELERRNAGVNNNDWFIEPKLAPMQQKFIEDPARFKLARTSRQSGKTFAVCQLMIYTAIRKPKAEILLIGLTRDNVKALAWNTLKDLLYENNISFEPYEAELFLQFPNGSRIKLVGADLAKAADRLRGRTFDLVICDECAFSRDADYLISVILPTLVVREGSLVMTSSPGPCSGLFYEADEGNAQAEWSRYSWQMRDNPSIGDRAEEEIAKICRLKYGNDSSDPVFRREWRGEWVRDDRTSLFCFNPVEHSIDKTPPAHRMRYVIAMDLGWNDRNAIVVIGYIPNQRRMYAVEEWSKGQILNDELSEQVKLFIDKYNPEQFVGDSGGYGMSIVQELRIKHGLPIISAQKKDKAAMIRSINSELKLGNLKISSACSGLEEQLLRLERDPDTGIEHQHAKCDLADAFIYAVRHCFSFIIDENDTNNLDEKDKIMVQLREKMRRQKEEGEWYGN